MQGGVTCLPCLLLLKAMNETTSLAKRDAGLWWAQHGSSRKKPFAGGFLIAILKSHFFLSRVAMAKRANQCVCQIFPASTFHLTWMVQVPVTTNRENRNISVAPYHTSSSNELTERSGGTHLINPANAHSSQEVRRGVCPVFTNSPHLTPSPPLFFVLF